MGNEQGGRENKDEEHHRDNRHLARPSPVTDSERLVDFPPAICATLDQTKDQGRHGNDGVDSAEPVNAASVAVFLRLRNGEQRTNDDDHTDGDVDTERPSPRVVGGEPSTQKWTDSNHSTDGGTPDRERDAAFLALEVCVDQRQCGGQNHGATEALQHACCNQQVTVLGESCDD